MVRFNQLAYSLCLYCQEAIAPSSIGKVFPVCPECHVWLAWANEKTFTLRLKYLIRTYQREYRVMTDAKAIMLRTKMGAAEQLKYALNRAKGERKVRGLLSAYKYRKLIEELNDGNPEEQLVLRPKLYG